MVISGTVYSREELFRRKALPGWFSRDDLFLRVIFYNDVIAFVDDLKIRGGLQRL